MLTIFFFSGLVLKSLATDRTSPPPHLFHLFALFQMILSQPSASLPPTCPLCHPFPLPVYGCRALESFAGQQNFCSIFFSASQMWLRVCVCLSASLSVCVCYVCVCAFRLACKWKCFTAQFMSLTNDWKCVFLSRFVGFGFVSVSVLVFSLLLLLLSFFIMKIHFELL